MREARDAVEEARAITERENLPPLTDLQELFCREYVTDFNATRAYREVYKDNSKSISTKAYDTVNQPQVMSRIQDLGDQIVRKIESNSLRVLKEMSLVAFSDIAEVDIDKDGALVVSDDAPKGASRTVKKLRRKYEIDPKTGHETVTSEIEFWSKDRALENLAKHHGLLVHRHELSGPGGKPIKTETTDKGMSEETAKEIREKILGVKK